MSYASTVLGDSPVVFLQLDETTGTSAADSGSNAVAWTYQTGVTLGSTAVFPVGGTAINPPGNGSAAILSSVPSTLANPRGTSIEVSVYLPDFSQKGAFVRIGNGNGWSVGVGSGSMDTAGNNLIILQENVGWYDSGVAIGTGNHYIVVTNSSTGTLSFYVDGNLVKTITGVGAPITATTGLYLAGGATRYLASTVKVDNLALYSTVLTSTQVSNHWAQISAVAPPATDRLSSVSMEVVAAPSITPRILSSVTMEVLAIPTSPTRLISSVSMEVLDSPIPPPRLLSSVSMEVLLSSRVPSLVSAAYVESVTYNATPPRIVSAAYVESVTFNASPPRIMSMTYLEVLTPSAMQRFVGWGAPIIG